jgi:preprotein translocase subunit SecF
MVDLMGKKNYFFALSILIFIVGIVGIFVNGIQMDIQFQGGTIMQIEMPDDTFSTDRAEDIVMETIGKKANVMKSSTYNAENEAENINLMVLNIASSETLKDVERQSVLKALRTEFNIPEDSNVTVNSVEPFIGDEIRTNSIYAILVSSILIILYVWIRFRNMQGLSAGVFAVLALLHDIFVMFTVYVLFKIPLNDSFVAAMLTIIGYSINDTVIIYDRVRENMKIYRKMPIRELVNKSVIQTVSRSINTSITTLIAILTLYVFSVIYNIESIKEFTMPLVVGIISGVYSTIFIASPLYMIWQERRIGKKVAPRKPAKA